MRGTAVSHPVQQRSEECEAALDGAGSHGETPSRVSTDCQPCVNWGHMLNTLSLRSGKGRGKVGLLNSTTQTCFCTFCLESASKIHFFWISPNLHTPLFGVGYLKRFWSLTHNRHKVSLNLRRPICKLIVILGWIFLKTRLNRDRAIRSRIGMDVRAGLDLFAMP